MSVLWQVVLLVVVSDCVVAVCQCMCIRGSIVVVWSMPVVLVVVVGDRVDVGVDVRLRSNIVSVPSCLMHSWRFE